MGTLSEIVQVLEKLVACRAQAKDGGPGSGPTGHGGEHQGQTEITSEEHSKIKNQHFDLGAAQRADTGSLKSANGGANSNAGKSYNRQGSSGSKIAQVYSSSSHGIPTIEHNTTTGKHYKF